MQQETFESLLIKHPEVQTLKVKFSGFHGEGMNDYVDLYDPQGHMIDADIGTALDKIADYGAGLMAHAMERAGLDGIQDNEGGAVSATFEITRDEEGVSILAASDHVERFYTESTEQAFKFDGRDFSELLSTPTKYVTDEALSKLTSMTPIHFSMEFSGRDVCICIDESSVSMPKAINSRLTEDLRHAVTTIKSHVYDVANEILPAVTGVKGNDTSCNGVLDFALNASGKIELDASRCKLLYHGERMESSGETMVGSRYQIKGDEIYDIKDLDDCLDGAASTVSLSPSM